MTKKLIKKIWIFMIFPILTIVNIPCLIFANGEDIEVDWFNIIPELEPGELEDINKKIDNIWKTWWHVWEEYNKAASGMSTSKQLASWIMTRDTIMEYIVFVVKFLSQLWLLVWTWFIMYAWYKYMVSVFNWWKTPSSTLENAIIWVIIVIFSYAIMKTLTSLIWIS